MSIFNNPSQFRKAISQHGLSIDQSGSPSNYIITRRVNRHIKRFLSEMGYSYSYLKYMQYRPKYKGHSKNSVVFMELVENKCYQWMEKASRPVLDHLEDLCKTDTDSVLDFIFQHSPGQARIHIIENNH